MSESSSGFGGAAEAVANRIPPWLVISLGMAAFVGILAYIAIVLFAWFTGSLVSVWGLTVLPREDERLAALSGTALPIGTVIAVDSVDGCSPLGDAWSNMGTDQDLKRRFAGRVLVVAGDPVSRANNGSTTVREYDKPTGEGGRQEVALTVPQMPVHSHSTRVLDYPSSSTPNNQERGRYRPSADDRSPTSEEGGGQAHENMPPFIALHFCKKVA